MIKVSVIIPVFNQDPPFLRAALLSAKLQIHPCEIIIVDDGSNPPQEEVVASILAGYTQENKASKVRAKYLYQKNTGVAGALNRAIKESTGEYLQWLPSDDLFKPEKTVIQLETMQRHNALVSYTAYEEGIPFTQKIIPALTFPDQQKLLNTLLGHCFINAGTMMWHRTVFDKVGMFDSRFTHTQDYHMILKCATAFEILGINVPLVRRRIHSGQMSQTLQKAEQAKIKDQELELLHTEFGITIRKAFVPGKI